jgi:hypothetical protein
MAALTPTPRRRPCWRLVPILAAVALVSACGGTDLTVAAGGPPSPTPAATPTVTPTAGPPTSVAEARAAWAAHVAADPDYVLELGVSVFSPVAGVYRVEVADGAVDRVVVVQSMLGVRPGRDITGDERLAGLPLTVEALHDVLARAEAKPADRLEVTYDASGVPREVAIDWDERIADEEQYFEAAVLPAPAEG